MSFTVPYKEVNNALNQMKAVVPAKNYLCLSTIGGKLTIAGIYGTWIARAVIDTDTDDEILASVSFADMRRILDGFRDQNLTLSCDGNNVSINGLPVTTKYDIGNSLEFLDFLDNGELTPLGGFRIPREELTTLVDNAAAFTDRAYDDLALASMTLKMLDNRTVEITSMNGHQFFYDRLQDVNLPGLKRGAVYMIGTPRILLWWLKKLPKKASVVEIRTNGSHIFFRSDRHVLRVSLVKSSAGTMEYPDYTPFIATFIDEREHEAKAVFWTSDLVTALKQLSPYVDESCRSVLLDFSTGTFAVHGASNGKEISVPHVFSGSIDEYDGKSVNRIAFPLFELLNAVTRLDEERVSMEFTTTEGPMRLKTARRDMFIIVMPIKILPTYTYTYEVADEDGQCEHLHEAVA